MGGRALPLPHPLSVRHSVIFEITHLDLLCSPGKRLARIQVCDDWLCHKRPHRRGEAQQLHSPPLQSTSQLEKLCRGRRLVLGPQQPIKLAGIFVGA